MTSDDRRREFSLFATLFGSAQFYSRSGGFRMGDLTKSCQMWLATSSVITRVLFLPTLPLARVEVGKGRLLSTTRFAVVHLQKRQRSRVIFGVLAPPPRSPTCRTSWVSAVSPRSGNDLGTDKDARASADLSMFDYSGNIVSPPPPCRQPAIEATVTYNYLLRLHKLLSGFSRSSGFPSCITA